MKFTKKLSLLLGATKAPQPPQQKQDDQAMVEDQQQGTPPLKPDKGLNSSSSAEPNFATGGANLKQSFWNKINDIDQKPYNGNQQLKNRGKQSEVILCSGAHFY